MFQFINNSSYEWNIPVPVLLVNPDCSARQQVLAEQVETRARAATVGVFFQGRRVASHARSLGRHAPGGDRSGACAASSGRLPQCDRELCSGTPLTTNSLPDVARAPTAFTIRAAVCLAVLALCGWAAAIPMRAQSPDAAAYWPQWRGPLSTGEAPHGNPPVRWDERTHVRWKIAIPGLGHATPVVWGDRIFVQTAVPAVEEPRDRRGLVGRVPDVLGPGVFRYDILALSRADGRLLWRRTARTEAPHEGRHEDGSWASGSPVTDGEHLFAYFGSRGLYCYDPERSPH